jgi:hypothetical protein
MKSRRKQNIIVFAIFLVVIVLLYSIVGGGNAQSKVIYTSQNLSNHSVTAECPIGSTCQCFPENVDIVPKVSYGEVSSNVLEKETYVNAIGHKKFTETFPSGDSIALGIYNYTGQVKLPARPSPDVNQKENPQAVHMMIQLWDGRNGLWDSNKTSLEGSIYWDLNPWTQDGMDGKTKIYIKGVDSPIDTGINITPNTKWHTFELVVDFQTKKYVSISFDDNAKNLENYELAQVYHGPGSSNPWGNDISLSITTESLAAWPGENCNDVFTWTTQFKDLNLSNTSTPPVTAKITEPEDGFTVYDDPVSVYGMVKNFANDELSLWACVKSYDGIWYPQETLTMIGKETWEADTSIPTNPADIGKKFVIVVLVATEEADKELYKPLIGEGDTADGWGLSALPEGAKTLDQITVIRGKR